ncbi:MAG: nitrite reductase large subunit NirB [Pseudomonadota bacterium]
MDRQRLVVIGNGMAGMRTVEHLLRLAPGRYAITVIGSEPRGNYNRILLSPVLAGEKAFADALLHDLPWYAEQGIELIAGATVTAIDRERRCALTDKGQSIRYDRLLLATGSEPFMPPLPGIELPGVLGFRDLDDVQAMLDAARQHRHAVVIGGGILGLEAADALTRRGMQVIVVHRNGWLMDRQLDETAARMLQDALEARGIRFALNGRTAALEGHARVTGVRLETGEVLPADLVVVTAGVRPRIELARAAGLDCGRGVIVDDHLATSDPAILAVGECIEHRGETFGLVAPLWEQAEVLARRLAGDASARYEGTVTQTRLKVTGIEVFSAGDFHGGEGCEVLTLHDPVAGHYRRLALRDGHLAGAVLYGDASDGGWYFDLMQSGHDLSYLRQQLIFGEALCRLDEPEPAAQCAARSPVMNKPTLIVAGHGMVGHSLLEKLVERGLRHTHRVIVFGEEPRPAYDRVHLSEYFGGRTAEDLSMVPEGFFEQHGIELRLGTPVTAIDRVRKCVTDGAGHETPYDTLVLATGSYPFVPPLEGRGREACLVYRTIEDLESITHWAAQSKTGVVVGGGLLGLEAANALRQLGLETHVVEFAPRLMPVQLDEGGGAMLRRKIEDLGVRVHTGKNTQRIVAGEHARHRMEFADGEFLETDLILFSAGIRPRDQLARDCGLDVGPRGGIVIDNQCRTSDPSIFAIGECALWNGQIFGLVAPGYQMARVVADELAGKEGAFTGADMSTKLKLLGVDVASIGDAHGATPGSLAYTYVDGPNAVYKKIVVCGEAKTLLGAVLVGDANEYGTLLQMALNGIPLPEHPDSLILPAREGSMPKALGVAALPATAQICSCHNVSKGDITAAVEGGCTSVAELKAATRVATGCGGCAALVKQVLDFELAQRGVEVRKDLCEHFAHSRQELYHLVKVGGIKTFDELIARHGKGHGCDICKPAAASILASVWNEYVLKDEHFGLQDTNDRYLANMQKDGSYSIVPRIPGGEITPDGLLAIGGVAKKYGLYTKITGGQRIDLFGARLEQLPLIWRELIDAGFETGQAYGKSLRTVKSCVGSTWCRYGVQDSTGLAIELENRYKGLRAPHKIKFAVSGCTRECAEAQGKDVGVIATDKGWNLYVCGNGGMKPRHADLFAADLDKDTLIRYIDRFLMFYVQTADRLQRTSTWMDNLEGGIDYLRGVVIHDSLGLGEELEARMRHVVDTFQCEWRTTIENQERLKLFRAFVNSDAPDENIVFVEERGQIRPATEEEKALRSGA